MPPLGLGQGAERSLAEGSFSAWTGGFSSRRGSWGLGGSSGPGPEAEAAAQTLRGSLLTTPSSGPACCSGRTGASSASCRRSSGGTPPSTAARPPRCCLRGGRGRREQRGGGGRETEGEKRPLEGGGRRLRGPPEGLGGSGGKEGGREGGLASARPALAQDSRGGLRPGAVRLGRSAGLERPRRWLVSSGREGAERRQSMLRCCGRGQAFPP